MSEAEVEHHQQQPPQTESHENVQPHHQNVTTQHEHHQAPVQKSLQTSPEREPLHRQSSETNAQTNIHSPSNGIGNHQHQRSSISQGTDGGRSQNNSLTRKQRLVNIPGFVIDELTEYAMAKEGIDIEDLQPKPFEEFLKECNGNAKLAQMRFEYKEAERQGLIQDIDNRKKIINLEIANDNHLNTLSPDPRTPAPKDFFYSTHQPNLMQNKQSKLSQSHAQLSTATTTGFQIKNQKSKHSGQAVDNKIFENMLRNQVEQEHKLRQIQERQEMFLMKSYQMQEKRQREIMIKQQVLQQKQLLKEEKLRRQEELQRQWQQETLAKLKMKSELTEQRQNKYKEELRAKMHQKEMKKEMKKQFATEQYNLYMESLQKRQEEVEVKNHEFQKKIDQRSKQQKDMIRIKKQQKEKVLNSVQEMRDLDEQKKLDRFMQAQFIEMEKERKIEEDRKRQQELRAKKGYEKAEKIVFKVEEAYKKMQDWQSELEKRERAATDNLKKQQKILVEKQQIKGEMKKLKQESAHLKQKRKENKEKLKKDEQMQKWQTMSQKIEQFKHEQICMKQLKQQEIFKAEQKRADMKTAFYHMAVWNVQEAGDIIKEIMDENDKAASGQVKPKSVAEKVREKAAKLRRDERLGLSKMSPKGYENGLNFIHEEEDGQQENGYQQQTHETQFDRAQSSQQQQRVRIGVAQQNVVYDQRQHE